MTWSITSAVKLGTPDEQALVKALQGHPETGALRGKHTNKILDNLVIVYTTHERSIYGGKIDAKVVHPCRQVAVIAVACSDLTVAQGLERRWASSHKEFPALSMVST
jgi:hypothetical protein